MSTIAFDDETREKIRLRTLRDRLMEIDYRLGNELRFIAEQEAKLAKEETPVQITTIQQSIYTARCNASHWEIMIAALKGQL